MKNVLTTVRLPEKILKELDNKAKKEKTDRTTVVREFSIQELNDLRLYLNHG